MRALTSAVLVSEAIVLGLLIPVAVVAFGYPVAVGWAIGGLALFCLLLPALYRKRYFLALGSAIQVVAIALGLLVPMMAILGGAFTVLWITAIRIGRNVEAADARARAAAEGAPSRSDVSP